MTRLAEAAERTADDGLRRVVLDEAWRHLVLRRSAAPTVLPLAARLLDCADDCVRLKAAHILAMLAPDSGPYADRLAALLDDPGTDEISWIEGTVGGFARWALVRLGDPRGLPGLVESLWAPYREQFGRSWVAAIRVGRRYTKSSRRCASTRTSCCPHCWRRCGRTTSRTATTARSWAPCCTSPKSGGRTRCPCSPSSCCS